MKKERGQVGGQRASVAPIIHGLSCKTARVYGRAKNIIIILSITGQAGFQLEIIGCPDQPVILA